MAVVGGSTITGLRSADLAAAEPPITPTRSGGENWIGEIVTIPYNFAPRGFAFCEGQEMQVQQNQSLYSLIGNYYGGDGRTTFNLPDTRALEAAAKKQMRAQRPPFRYAIALTGLFPSRA
jgi:microcystin-dependent protein